MKHCLIHWKLAPGVLNAVSDQRLQRKRQEAFCTHRKMCRSDKCKCCAITAADGPVCSLCYPLLVKHLREKVLSQRSELPATSGREHGLHCFCWSPQLLYAVCDVQLFNYVRLFLFLFLCTWFPLSDDCLDGKKSLKPLACFYLLCFWLFPTQSFVKKRSWLAT